MKKRDPKKQAQLQKVTTKRALYEKARKQKIKLQKRLEADTKAAAKVDTQTPHDDIIKSASQ
jgi:hypothetical protein